MKIRTALKALSLIFTLLLVVVVTPLGYLMLSDANDFKPQLQELALEQGVQLDIAGDLNWQIYPDIELEISDVNIKSEKDSLGLNATLGMAKLQVELRPLFSGELKVRGVEVSNSRLSIIELAETSDVGTENLEKITGQSGTAIGIKSESEDLQKSPDSENSTAVSAQSISFQKLSFQKLHLEYKPIDGVATALSIDNLNIEQLNLVGGQFPISLNLAYQGGQQNATLSTNALLSIDLDKQNYTLSTEQLTLDLAGEQSFVINAEMSAAINLISNQWNLALTQAHLEDLEIKANASGSVEPPTALGQLEFEGGSQFVNGLAGQRLLETLIARAGFDYSPERLFLNDVSVKFNESNLESSVKYYLNGDSRSQLRLSMDKVNLDTYLAIDSEEQNANSSGEENPLMFLETISATDVFLNIGELSSNGQKLTDIKVEVAIDHSEASVQLTNATLAGGVIKGTVLARATELPQLVISGFTANQVSLAPLTLNESGKPLLQGIADLSFDGQLASLSAEGSMLKGLDGGGQLDAKDLQLADTNIEQSICASAKKLGATAALTEQWASGTQFDQLSSPYDISKGLLSLEKIGTGFGNIKLGGNGELDLGSMNFGAKLSLRIEGERTSEQGCSINKYLRNTSLPLSCEGNLAEGGETSCGLDSSVVGKLLAGQLKNELGRQLGRLLGGNKDEADAASEGSSEETEQGSSEQVKDAVKSLLEGLFK